MRRLSSRLVTRRASADGLNAATQKRPFHKLLGLFDDALMLLLVIWLFPLVILLVGAPVGLLIEIAKRM